MTNDLFIAHFRIFIPYYQPFSNMTDIQLYTKLSGLPANLKEEVEDFIDFLLNKKKENVIQSKKRVPGKAKGLIKMKDNFDDPIEGFNDYLK